jgi:hypothetical protein
LGRDGLGAFEESIFDSTKAITGTLVSDAFFPAAAAKPLYGRVHCGKHLFEQIQESIGRKLPLNGRDFALIGVMPSGFASEFAAPKGVDLWIPLPP